MTDQGIIYLQELEDRGRSTVRTDLLTLEHQAVLGVVETAMPGDVPGIANVLLGPATQIEWRLSERCGLVCRQEPDPLKLLRQVIELLIRRPLGGHHGLTAEDDTVPIAGLSPGLLGELTSVAGLASGVVGFSEGGHLLIMPWSALRDSNPRP